MQVQNVIVDNGISQHKVQYNYSPQEIRNCSIRALFNIKSDVINEINEKGLTVLIVCDLTYNKIISKTIIGASNELLFKFNFLD